MTHIQRYIRTYAHMLSYTLRLHRLTHTHMHTHIHTHTHIHARTPNTHTLTHNTHTYTHTNNTHTYVTWHEKTMLMYTKYTSSRYFNYLSFCISNTGSVIVLDSQLFAVLLAKVSLIHYAYSKSY